MREGEAKTLANSKIAFIAIEIKAIQDLAASAENSKIAAQAAALALSEGGTSEEETPTPVTPETPETPDKLDVGMIAGISVGVVLLLIVIAVLVYFFVIRKRANIKK